MKDNKLSLRKIIPPWLSGSWGGLAVFFTLYSLVYLAWIFFHWGGEENVTLIGDLFYIPLDIVAVLAAWHVFSQKGLDSRIRRMWLLLGLGLLSYFIADLIWTYLENVLEVPPFPAVSDLFYLLFAPLAFAGMLSLPSAPLNRRERWQFILDMLVIMTASGILMWHFVIQPTAVANAGDFVSQAVAVAYPVSDFILIAGIVAALLRQPDRDTHSALWLILLGMVFFVTADVAFGYANLAGTYITGSWIDAGWNIAHLFFLFAALRHVYRAPETTEPLWMTRLAQSLRGALYVTVVFAFGLTVYEGITDFGNPNYFWLLAGAGVLLVLMIIQQVVSARFNEYSLRTKLVAAFLVVTLLPMAVLFFINDNVSRQNLTNDANRTLSSAASAAANDVDAFIAEGLNNVRTAAQSYIWEEYLSLPPAERAGSQLEYAVNIDLRALARRDQIFIDAVGLMDKNGIDVADSVAGEVGSDKSTHAYIAGPIRTGLPYSTVQFSPTTNKLSVYFSAPVRDANGNLIGVLRIRYNAAVLQQIITQATIEQNLEGGDLILFDENHIRLADSDSPDLILKSIVPLPADKLAQLQAERRLPSDQPIEKLSTNLPEFDQGLSNMVEQPVFSASTHSGESKIEQIAVATMDSQPWLVAAAQQQSIYLAPVAAQTRTAGVTVLSIAVLVALAALAMAQTISNPIVQLRNVANQIAGGDFNAQAAVRSGDETGQLANAFNNMTGQLKKSFENLDRRAREVATMAEVSRRLSTILDRKQLVSEVVNQVNSAFGYYHTQIYFFDDARENLVMAGGTGEAGQLMLAQFHKVVKGRGLVGRAAESNKPVLVSDTTKNTDWLPNVLLPDTKSEAAIPISIGSEVLGVLDVQHNVKDGLQQEVVDSLQSITNQVAVALQNIRQYENTRKIAADMGVVANVGIAASTITEAGRLLQEVVDLSKKSFNLYHAHIYLMNEAGDSLDLASGAGEVGKQMVSEKRSIPLNSEQSLVARAARTREGVVVNDVTLAPDFLPNPLLPNTRSEMAVPMIVAGRAIGVLDVQSETANRFTDVDVSIQTTLASQVAVALQNARSFAQSQRQAERETSVNLITQRIQNTTSIEAALQMAARELGHALGMKSTLVTLDPEVLAGERKSN